MRTDAQQRKFDRDFKKAQIAYDNQLPPEYDEPEWDIQYCDRCKIHTLNKFNEEQLSCCLKCKKQTPITV